MSVPMRWESYPVPEAPVESPGTPRRRRRATHRSRKIRIALGFALSVGLCGLAVVGARSMLRGAAVPALHLEAPHTLSGQVALGAATLERRLGFVTVTGNVISRTTTSLPMVEAVVELLDTQGKTLQMESGMIAFDPLPPRETAPFRVDLPDNARAVACRVRFKQLLGRSLN